MSLPGTCSKRITEKWHYFKTKFWPVLRKLKMETEDDRDFVGEYLGRTILMIPISIAIYSICYLTFEFKTVRLKLFQSLI